MANNDRGQTLTSKYVWVIETIYRRKKISFKELNERWVDDIDISRGVDIPKRTFDNWRYAIQDMFGIIISYGLKRIEKNSKQNLEKRHK